MIWEICLSCLGVRTSSLLEESFYFLSAQSRKCFFLIYVDDIMIIGDEAQEISKLKLCLLKSFK